MLIVVGYFGSELFGVWMMLVSVLLLMVFVDVGIGVGV